MTQTQKLSPKEHIANILGVEPEKIAVSNPDYARLLKEGVMIIPHVSYWRGRTRLNWEHMGLWFVDQAEKTAVEAVMNLGQMNLLPTETIKALGTLETKIRMLPKKYGIETMFGMFIPVTSYADFKAEADTLLDEFFQIRDNLYNAWNTSMGEVETHLRAAARWAWRYKAGDPKGLKEYQDENRFVDKMVNAALALVPSQDTVYKSYALDFEMRVVNLPDQLAAELAQAEIERSRAEAEISINRANAQAAWAQTSTVENAERERANMLRQMNEDMVNQSRANAQKMMDDFFLNLVSESRQLAYEVYAEVAKGIKKNGKVHGRSVVSLRNLVTQVTKLTTFYGSDRDLEALLRPAREILEALPEHRIAKTDNYLEEMAKVRALAKEQLADLGLAPRAGRGIEISSKEIEFTQRKGRAGNNPFEIDGIVVTKREKRAISPIE